MQQHPFFHPASWFFSFFLGSSPLDGALYLHARPAFRSFQVRLAKTSPSCKARRKALRPAGFCFVRPVEFN